MNKLYYFLFLIPVLALGQSQNQNYVKSKTYRDSILGVQAIESITYFDGLGRPIQQVAAKQSATGKDIVTHIEYDALGRQAKEYLPYPASGSTMAFTDPAAALQETLSYYQAAYADATPFSQKLFEASPLNRILQQASPGDAWKLGSGHEIRTDYRSNAAGEVLRFGASASWDAFSGLYLPALQAQGSYPEGYLYKTVTKDENWTPSSGHSHTVQEFKDREGRVVLKRAYGTSSDHSHNAQQVWHDTYYVYDQFGSLTYVMPPLSAKNGAQGDLDGLCYQYRYDYRGRLAEKKLPGRQWEFIVYDRLDRVVASGPCNSPFGEAVKGWAVTKYDVLGRVAYTGWYSGQLADAAGRRAMQALFTAQAPAGESRITSGTIGNIQAGYSNSGFPASGLTLLTASYYDDYAFPNAPAVPSQAEGQAVLASAKGLPTGTWTRALTNAGETAGETSAVFYDRKGRPVRTHAVNFLGGYTRTDSRLDFSGKTLYTITAHKRLASGAELKTREDFEYSAQDRLVRHTHQVNSGTAELLSKNEYDELGQLVRKSVGGTDLSGAAALQQVNYGYNIRGWLTGINAGLPGQGDPADLFVFGIKYNAPLSAQPLYNGNISETLWRTSSDNIQRKYDYAYDELNRLIRSSYSKPHAGFPLTNAYSEALEYDSNGNITRLMRNGNNDGTIGLEIDNLDYAYDPANPNRLMKVADGSNSPVGFRDGTNSGNDYAYDDFGNLTGDANKGMLSIGYNHLNLPANIVFGIGNNKISYLYDANGKKLRRSIPYVAGNAEGGYGAFAVEYLEGFQYESGTLKFFPTSEGYVLKTGSAYSYVYNYTDHLGNVRLSYAKDQAAGTLKIVEESHYYPFGLKHANYNTDILAASESQGKVSFRAAAAPVNPNPIPVVGYNYKFLGMEFQDELGLNLYDYGTRNYDPAIGRWMNIDPLADTHPGLTPYRYSFNNPVNATDPTGLLEDWVNTDGQMLYDSRVTDQATATQYYGAGSTYRENGYSYTASSGESIVLGDMGFYTENGNLSIADDAAFPEAVDHSGSIMAGGLATAGVLVADDVTGIGVADDVAIPPVLAVAASAAIVAKATYEITSILQKNSGQDGVQYSLRASATGQYPVMSSGSSVPTGTVSLNAGDVWKYGETTNPAGRYTPAQLNAIGPGVRQVNEFSGSQRQVKIAEKAKIYNYYLQNGQLPPGNKIFR